MSNERTFQAVISRNPRVLSLIAVLVLLLCFLVLASRSVNELSLTLDEPVYIGSGIEHLCFANFQKNKGHPPLLKILFVLPAWQSCPHASAEFVRLNLLNLLHDARWISLALSVLLALTVFAWAREDFGRAAGVLALLLCCFHVEVLAHGTLATLDMGLTCFSFITMYFFRGFLLTGSKRSLLCATIAFALALSSKLTAAILLPLMVLLLLLFRPASTVRSWQHSLLVGATALFCFILGLHLPYAGQDSFLPLGDYPTIIKALGAASPFVADLPLPLPKAFVESFIRIATQGNSRSYLLGEISSSTWWYYYVVAFVVKTPLPFLLLLFVPLLPTNTQPVTNLQKSSRQILWISLFTFAVLISLLSRANIGLRYLLPVYPFLFVLLASVLAPRLRMLKVQALVISFLLGWYVLGAFRTAPDFLSSFSELIGGRKNARQYLADSNLDWGQNLIQLRSFLNIEKIDRILLLDSDPFLQSRYVSLYSIPHQNLSAVNHPSGYLAVSVNALVALTILPISDEEREFLRSTPPTFVVNDITYLYRLPGVPSD